MSTDKPPPPPIIIGLYGIPGSGKSHLLNKLQHFLPSTNFLLFEGSEILGHISGGLPAFLAADNKRKIELRSTAIQEIRRQCVESGKTGIVTGHACFWNAESKSVEQVHTKHDWDVFTHVVFLNPSVEVLAARRERDEVRSRKVLHLDSAKNLEYLHLWQDEERLILREVCRECGLLFVSLDTGVVTAYAIAALLREFAQDTVEGNLLRAEACLDEAISATSSASGYNGLFLDNKKKNLDHNSPSSMINKLGTVLIFDADRTLAPQDTGLLFWKKYHEVLGLPATRDPLKALFSGPLAYSYTAFHQAALLYSELAEGDFNEICKAVAEEVTLYDELLALIRQALQTHNIRVVVMTCGLRCIWEHVLNRAGLASNSVSVIGSGGRITSISDSDSFGVTPEVKGLLVTRLRNQHKLHTIAFGDSPLDIPMLLAATRSTTMDTALYHAITAHKLQAKQLLLPPTVLARPSSSLLPELDVSNLGSLLSPRFTILLATNLPTSKLLSTNMRDASLHGPALQTTHSLSGWYLATSLLPLTLPLEKKPITHVQGHTENSGVRLAAEESTLIISLMRGGDPMARGVHNAFPNAKYLHAFTPANITATTLLAASVETVLLVDSVINTGKSILEFATHIRALNPSVTIVVVAGVVQEACLQWDSVFRVEALRIGGISVVALRVSANKFTGKGATDTGNRLFNTV
jgi:phosphoserine phosphatase/uracil phosphoribosyltransferase